MNLDLQKERKEKIYGLICDEQYVPMKTKEIAILLDIPKEQRGELQEVLDALVEEGRVQVSVKGKYRKAEKSVARGSFVSHARGFGFVTVEGEPEDYFISEKNTGDAFWGDIVEIERLPAAAGKRKEAKVIRVLKHTVTTLVGTYEKGKSHGFVTADQSCFLQDIMIPRGKAMGAVSGHKVVCKITGFGGRGKNPEGEIIEILGHINDPGVDILALAKSYELPMEFPEEVLQQAGRCAGEVSKEDWAGRLDLRDVTMVTIDGEDAKDLDDAVSVEKLPYGYVLGVHIADVANYVRENSSLDAEAKKRGTSVYLVDRVIPMLPHALSNGICSLNQGEDRLALSCMMAIDEKGNVVDHTISETVIRVNQRMSYSAVKKILEDEDAEEIERYKDLVPMFRLMEELSGLLRAKRMRRGAIDFDFPETKITLDEKGHAKEIAPYERNVATRMIEDFMLLANETVAEDFYWQELPFLYRVHEVPDKDKINQLSAFVSGFGYSVRRSKSKGEIHPRELQKLLMRIKETPQENLISRLTLRSMPQAKYDTVCSGHFGLAADYYCHFTSPIRRYPDLQIHRIIKENLRGRLDENRRLHYQKILPAVASGCSKLERRADDVEREADKMKKVEYMAGHLGEVWDGVISGVTKWGLYVELPNTVEGLVPIADIPGDWYILDEEGCRLIGERTNRQFMLGQHVKVVAIRCDKLARTIDFSLVEDADGKR